MIHWIKETFPKLVVIASSVVTHKQATNLIAAGADGLRVTMGSGSICITQEVMAIGQPQALTESANKLGISVIANGGVGNMGHTVEALALGASAVMIGELLADTSEAPGEYSYHDGKRVKAYRGMGSLEAMEAGKPGVPAKVNGKPGSTKHAPQPTSAPQENAAMTRYFSESSAVKVAQGVSGDVQDKGSVKAFLPYLYVGVQHSLQDIGVRRSVDELKEGVKVGCVRFELRRASAQVEGGVHGLNSCIFFFFFFCFEGIGLLMWGVGTQRGRMLEWAWAWRYIQTINLKCIPLIIFFYCKVNGEEEKDVSECCIVESRVAG